jgi:UDP-N-acetylglucosamine/UDP-N-acetylgalactosamine diphosphorylase
MTIKVSSEADRVVVAKTQEAGQGHVFDGWPNLAPDEQKALLAQLRSLDFPFLNDLIKRYREGGQRAHQERLRQPAACSPMPPDPVNHPELAAMKDLGEELLRRGRVAVLMAAGGLASASGAGSEPVQPEGLAPVGPVSNKCLFQFHVEKIRTLARRCRSAPPLFVVTSPQTHQRTIEAFQSQDQFGLNRQDLRFLVQAELPVIDRRGRFLLAEPGRLAMRPNGHGDALTQLLSDESFHALEVRGIEHVFYFQVDNPLVRIADPVFIGLHAAGDCDFSAKAVRKTCPDEKLGIFCQLNGTVRVVEPAEFSPEELEERRADGGLAFSSGNVAIHLLSMDFLRRIRGEKLSLPYHFVDRATPTLNRQGRRVCPDKANSVAFETFVFDALAWSKKTLVTETEREEEFSPIKNGRRQIAIEEARYAISRLHARWLQEAGIRFTCAMNGNGLPSFPVEISPLFAQSREEVREKVKEPFECASQLYLE